MLYIYKALNDMAPCYISAMTHLQNTHPAEYRQRLRSSSYQTRLIVSISFKRAGSGVTGGGGGGRGADSAERPPPPTSDQEIFADLPGKKRQVKREKGGKWRRKEGK